MGHRSTLREPDALNLLTRDHAAIRQLFQAYERLTQRHAEPERKAELVGQICFELSIHTQIEEEIFYPAVRAAAGHCGSDSGAVRDHVDGKALIAELDEMEPGDADFDATVAVLGARTVAHMEDEQAHIFAMVISAGLDTASLGRQMAQRQKALHDGVSVVGMSRSPSRGATWPAACRVVIA